MQTADNHWREDIVAPVLFSNFRQRALMRQRIRRFLSRVKRAAFAVARRPRK